MKADENLAHLGFFESVIYWSVDSRLAGTVEKVVRSRITGGSYEDSSKVGFGSWSRGGGLLAGRGGSPE